MAGHPKEEVNAKQLQALSMFDQGGKTIKDVAVAIGVSYDYLHDLISGNTASCGQTADLFKKAYQKIQLKRDQNIENLTKLNKEGLHGQILRVVDGLKVKKSMSLDEKKLLGSLMNSIVKAQPSVNIKNLSYSYTTGYSPEELIYEFSRLKGIAEASFNRGPVQGTVADRSRGLPASDESGSGLAEES